MIMLRQALSRPWLAALTLLVLCGTAAAQVPVKPCTDYINTTLGTHDCLGVSAANPFQITGPVTATPATPAAGSGNAGYPTGATPVGNAFSGADTTTAAATLPAAAGKFTYIAGFTVSGLGATATTTVNVTVGTLVGSTTPTYSYVFQTGATVVDTSVSVLYSPAIPANAINLPITVTVPGAAGNTATQINAWGYQQ
jgi:hypothetical protein